MAQTGFTPIQLYSTSTAAAAPVAGNLTNSTLGSELAINITDGKLFYKDNANAVQVIGWKTVPTTAGGTGLTTYTAGDLSYYASGTTFTKLAIGTIGQILTSTGSAPQWTTLSGVAVTTFSAGTTGFTPNSATSGAVTLAGTLATTNGGTGLTAFTANGVFYASSTSAIAQSANLTFNGTTLTTTGISTSNNLAFTGTGNRITGDFSTSVLVDRVSFQSSTTNGNTIISVIPNGTATTGTIQLWNNATPTNAAGVNMQATSTEATIRANTAGSGTALPLTIYTGGSERARMDTSGNFGLFTTSPSTFGKFAVQGAAATRVFYADSLAQPVARYDDNGFINNGFTLRNTGVSGTNQGIGLLFQLGASGTPVNSGAIEMRSTADYSSAGNQSASMTFGTINAGSLTAKLTIAAAGDVTVSAGNVVIATSGKGIDFSATSGTGTSELFDDYEEGTWTPTITNVTGTYTTTSVNYAQYTKIGEVVYGFLSVTVTTPGTASANMNFTLPFTPTREGYGSGRENVNTGDMLIPRIITGGGGEGRLYKTDGSAAGAAAGTYVVSFMYLT
jgi:hypothetical protein